MHNCKFCSCNICTNQPIYKGFDMCFCSIYCRDNYCNNNSINYNMYYMGYLQTIHDSMTEKGDDDNYTEKNINININLDNDNVWNIRSINCDIIKCTLLKYLNTYISYIY